MPKPVLPIDREQIKSLGICAGILWYFIATLIQAARGVERLRDMEAQSEHIGRGVERLLIKGKARLEAMEDEES